MTIKDLLFVKDEYGCDTPTFTGKIVFGILTAISFCGLTLIISRLIHFLMVLFT